MRAPVPPNGTELPAAPRVGADLRTAREHLGLVLRDVAADLHIRMSYLQALEEGRIALLPGHAYALAFVRTYATALGLDAEQMVRRFRTEAKTFSPHADLVFPAPMPERGLSGAAVLLLALVLVVGTYVGWYRLSAEGRLPTETVTAIPQRLAPLADQAPPTKQTLPAPPSPSTPDQTAPDQTAANATAATAPDDIALTGLPRLVLADPASPAIAPDPAPAVVAISPTSAAAAQLADRPDDPPSVAGSPPVPSTAPSAADTGRIVVRASADAWVLVKDRAGVVLLSRTMKAGETWPVPPRPDLLLTTGNAAATELLVDGAPTVSLGGSGIVRRDMPLDPDLIKDGKLAADATPQLASTRPHP